MIRGEAAPTADLDRFWDRLKQAAVQHAMCGEFLSEHSAREEVGKICAYFGTRPPPEALDFLARALMGLIVEDQAEMQP